MALDRTALFALATNEPLERAVKRVPGRRVNRLARGITLLRGPVAHRCARDGGATASTGAMGPSVDLFGERVRDPAAADRVVEEYC